MKLSVAIAHDEADELTFVVWRGFHKSIRKAAEYGYHGVELALKTADDINKGELAMTLEKYNMDVSCINTGQVFASLDLYFTHPDRQQRRKVIEHFKEFIDLASGLCTYINAGRVRGFVAENQSVEDARKYFMETAREICEIAANKDIIILIEPINRYETNFINNLDEAADIIKDAGYENLRLMPDVFHMNIEEARIDEALKKHSNLIKYIHFADSNRLAPGQGHVDFNRIFNSLLMTGFNGWACIEILPEPNPDTAAYRAARYILPKIEKYNRSVTSRKTMN